MLSYAKLTHFLKVHHSNITNFTTNYTVIKTGEKYHITIFNDQWDNYETVTDEPYYMYHITSNTQYPNKCSRYYRVSKKTLIISNIPHFEYGADTFSFYKSTRKPCDKDHLIEINIWFEKLLKNIQ